MKTAARIVPVILSGGSGSRLWPLSRASYPKQLWSLISQNSLLQETILRANRDCFADPIIICNNNHRFLIAEQLRAINNTCARIILEPVGKNSAPAIAAASLIASEDNLEKILWVMAADAVVEDQEALIQDVFKAETYAKLGHIVTFGIKPTRAETGYGYIEIGQPVNNQTKVNTVQAFTEKPNLVLAEKMLSSQKYLWNSGMFVFSAGTMLQEMQHYVPELLTHVTHSVEKRHVDLYFERLDEQEFVKAPDISIDYAIAEKSKRMLVVSSEFVWADIGSWDTLWDISSKDEGGNVSKGKVLLEDTHNSYVRSDDIVTAVNGLENVVVVVTKDAVLVTDRKKSQDVKKIVHHLNQTHQHEAVSHRRCYRPWGFYETLVNSHRFQVKQIIVNVGGELSLQKHFHRSEHWVVVSGVAKVIRGEENLLLRENESIYIPQGTIHRLKNPGRIPLVVIEIQSGSYLNEDDIVRLEDAYNR
ncbi:Alginate biosynthesis protein AlgA [Commensalibacter sp. Nvir]|uniref:mannose-1-phosphate guanylyltransferase/mannose-6-phosphate isomerase n=1 Tax=Commensalibacter sp. Nvir TaxID=3069817 RepID=UPI002D4393B8|nr:Alginate biosynthesis protein AlgA [Commensalibacter sp. Nvir]